MDRSQNIVEEVRSKNRNHSSKEIPTIVLIRKHRSSSLVELPTFIVTRVQLGKLASEKYTDTSVIHAKKAIPNTPQGPSLQETLVKRNIKETTAKESLIAKRSRMTVKYCAWAVFGISFLTVCSMLTFTSQYQDMMMKIANREKFRKLLEEGFNISSENLPWMLNME